MLRYAKLCYAILCHAMVPRYAMPCCVMHAAMPKCCAAPMSSLILVVGGVAGRHRLSGTLGGASMCSVLAWGGGGGYACLVGWLVGSVVSTYILRAYRRMYSLR
jgi:hypothetical protein